MDFTRLPLKTKVWSFLHKKWGEIIKITPESVFSVLVKFKEETQIFTALGSVAVGNEISAQVLFLNEFEVPEEANQEPLAIDFHKSKSLLGSILYVCFKDRWVIGKVTELDFQHECITLTSKKNITLPVLESLEVLGFNEFRVSNVTLCKLYII